MQLRAQNVGHIKGVVTEQNGAQRIGDVSIVNKRTQDRALTNMLGNFDIAASVGDTLIVTKYGYATKNQPISSAQDIVIRLDKNYMLDEVTITGRSKSQEMEDVMNDYRRQGVFNDGKTKPLQYVFTPLTALYNAFGSAPKNARRFNRYMNNELEESVVDKKFNKYNVSEITGLKDDDLNSFMAYYRPSFQECQYWNEYDIRKYLEKSLAQFEKDGKPKFQALPKIDIPPQDLNKKDN
ncbi:carboxypeptidase-like regulatory domain-containing protein [Olivibacter sitiensis]|uniref:carboxypeptidase-like regulatory domain-containing protein n=1 Tax=Olivibacter sitiensis TaxID=376470 RepID=UPI00146FC583|nr:carboxypeptidase-like regulatory domain-containing protein [Olivibacter sitiensis]